MISKIINLVLFIAGLTLGAWFGGWNSRKLEKAFEDLKATSTQVQAEQDKLISSLKAETEVSAARLKTEKEQAEQGLAAFEATRQATLKDRDAQIKALRAKAAEKTAAGNPKGAKEDEDEAEGLDCLEVPVPKALIRGLNGVSR